MILNPNNMDTFTGESLVKFIEKNPYFKELPIHYLLVELLKKKIIQPSAIIDAYSDLLNHKLMVAESHYEDACVTALQMESGNFSGDKEKEVLDRFYYNASFSRHFPEMCGRNLTEEEKKKWSAFWNTTYGFKPENER